MIISLFENNFPMRFGVILYSTKSIQKIESNIDELQLSSTEDDSQLEDVSSLVIASSLSTFFVPFILITTILAFVLPLITLERKMEKGE